MEFAYKNSKLFFGPEWCLAYMEIFKVYANLVKNTYSEPAHIREREVSHYTNLGI